MVESPECISGLDLKSSVLVFLWNLFMASDVPLLLRYYLPILQLEKPFQPVGFHESLTDYLSQCFGVTMAQMPFGVNQWNSMSTGLKRIVL